ncbi:MAG: hypothetical protein ACT4OO_07300 [Nitrospiraceae bacterium]
MLLAGIFAAVLFLGLVAGDWFYFVSLSPDASRYGCGVARTTECASGATIPQLEKRFDRNGLLALPHGVARLYPKDRRILLRPQYHLFSLRFRTAWPLKGSIDLTPHGTDLRLLCIKRIPWSSAIITMLWFALVGFGTVGFLLTYLFQGGLASMSGVLMGAGITGLGVLVLAFGLLTITLAYRLEDGRLTKVYEELRVVLDLRPTST